MVAHKVGQNDNEDFHTDKNDDANYQYMKVADGRPDRFRPLAVTSAKGVVVENGVRSAVGGVTVGETSYADREVIGGAIDVLTAGCGLYRIESLYAYLYDVGGFAADPFPDVAMAFGMFEETVAVDALVTDGFPIATADVSVIPALTVVDPTSFSNNWIEPKIVEADPQELLVATFGGGLAYTNASMKLWAFVIADGAVAVDFSGKMLAVSVVLTRLGDDSTIPE